MMNTSVLTVKMQHSTSPELPLKSYTVSSNVQCFLLGICVCYISSGCLQAIRSVLAVSSAVRLSAVGQIRSEDRIRLASPAGP